MKVYIETYGCALNKADTALMKSILVSRGHVIVEDLNEADVLLINTCTVRLDTEQKILKRLTQLKNVVSEGKKLVITGCMVSAQPYTVSKVVPTASLVSPQNVTRVWEAVESTQRVLLLDGVRDVSLLKPTVEGVVASIPIAEGCLGDCAFCITKIARRRLKSYKPEKVVEAVNEAVKLGAVEIDLTAQDTAAYGVDLGNVRLPALVLDVVSKVEGDYMVRVGMANPDTLYSFLDEFIEVLKHPKVFKYVHIPLQSASDKVLKIMKRRYTYEEFKSLVTEIRRKIPEVQIATDIIVGHPGEDEEDFKETLNSVKELMFDKVHIAQYTLRPRTEAAGMKQVPDPVKKRRSLELNKVVEEVGALINSQYVGSIALALISGTSFKGSLIGRLINYKPVVILNDGGSLGFKNYVSISSYTFYDLRGVILS